MVVGIFVVIVITLIFVYVTAPPASDELKQEGDNDIDENECDDAGYD